MLAALTIAANGMAVQSQRLEGIAASVAATGATEGSDETEATPSGRVRIGALPLGNEIESMVSLKEAELAYKANAAVFLAASDMLETLLDAVDPNDPNGHR